MAELKEQILEMIRPLHLAKLATVTDDGKPWVRYVMAAAGEDMTIRCATFVQSRKVSQIDKNPEVHLTCGISDPMAAKNYLQIEGRAELSTDEKERHAFWNDTLHNIFQGPDDPNYGVLIVKPYRIEFNTVGNFTPEVWEV
jgi:general stress protein 26